MKKDSENILLVKSKSFAIRIIRLYQFLSLEKKEFVLSKQLLRSGTSIGANAKEASRGQSRADFASKISVSLKEASESEYWLDLLYETEYISREEYTSLQQDLSEIIRILMSISRSVAPRN
ncbi:MAG: four helix bundle protein [Bacteroidales bacterium]|nr:four helix bundle protein [Bacteroidales bacterium]